MSTDAFESLLFLIFYFVIVIYIAKWMVGFKRQRKPAFNRNNYSCKPIEKVTKLQKCRENNCSKEIENAGSTFTNNKKKKFKENSLYPNLSSGTVQHLLIPHPEDISVRGNHAYFSNNNFHEYLMQNNAFQNVKLENILQNATCPINSQSSDFQNSKYNQLYYISEVEDDIKKRDISLQSPLEHMQPVEPLPNRNSQTIVEPDRPCHIFLCHNELNYQEKFHDAKKTITSSITKEDQLKHVNDGKDLKKETQDPEGAPVINDQLLSRPTFDATPCPRSQEQQVTLLPILDIESISQRLIPSSFTTEKTRQEEKALGQVSIHFHCHESIPAIDSYFFNSQFKDLFRFPASENDKDVLYKII